jgi:hypothetical protein
LIFVHDIFHVLTYRSSCWFSRGVAKNIMWLDFTHEKDLGIALKAWPIEAIVKNTNNWTIITQLGVFGVNI